MGNSIPFLELPIQLFSLGMAVGMTAALIEYMLTEMMDRFALTVALFAVPFFYGGLVIQILIEVT